MERKFLGISDHSYTLTELDTKFKLNVHFYMIKRLKILHKFNDKSVDKYRNIQNTCTT